MRRGSGDRAPSSSAFGNTRLRCSAWRGTVRAYYDASVDEAAEIECVDLSVEACEVAILAATAPNPSWWVHSDAAVGGEELRSRATRFRRTTTRPRGLYTGEARETASTLMKHK